MATKTTANKDSQIQERLNSWKKSLIDFSKKNQLLFFKARPTLSIKFDEKPEEICQKLIFENKSLGFIPGVKSFNVGDFGDEVEETVADFDSSINLEDDLLPPDLDSLEPGLSIEETLVDDEESLYAGDFDTESLHTDKDSRALEQVLSKLKTRSKTSLYEQGINILYLATYFLEWSENAETNYRSPLILVPVSLDRKGLSGAFRLNLIEDEIRINPTLAYKLERDYGIKIAEFENRLAEPDSVETLSSVINEITNLIQKDHPNAQIKEESFLGLFSFAKLSLYQDLETNETLITEHPIIKEICGKHDPENNKASNPIYDVKKEEIDTKLDANASRLILDADSSQEEAINAAKAGLSFVIQGPPGTGKSQTISNIIAESLAQGKKILFVSEKKSALDVVVSRLKIAGLDKFCLELHNPQEKKSNIINGIKTNIEEIKNAALDNQREEYLEPINAVKFEIQRGITQLHKNRQPINRSLYEIYGILSNLKLDLEAKSVDFTLASLERLDAKKLSDLDFFFKELAEQKEILENYDNFIWRNADVKNLSFELENAIKSNFIEFKNLIMRLEALASPLAEKYFNRKVTNLKEFKWLAEASKLAIESPFPKKDWFNTSNLSQVQGFMIEAKIEHEEYATTKGKLLSRYSDQFLELDHQELLTKFTQRFTGIFRFLNLDYWKALNQIKQLSLYNETRDMETIINDLQQAALLDKKSAELNQEGTKLSLVLGDFYKEFDTDWEETITAIKWVQKVLNKLNTDSANLPVINIISEDAGNDDFKDFQREAQDLIATYELIKYYSDFYRSIFPKPNLDIDSVSFAELENHVEDLITNIIKVESWIEFKQIQNKARELNIEEFIFALIRSGLKNLDDKLIKNLFMKKFYELWADKIEIENPEMRKFSGQAQQLLINKFINLDTQILKRNRLEVSKQLALKWIDFAANPENKDQIQVLSHELNKKKKHKPVRVLVQEIPNLLQTLKPCWMMSPLSVSQMVEASNTVNFDLVIFDEASQIRTEEAICSIYRAKQLILAGDSNQLPPTNFFNHIEDDDDLENSNFESVLDECSVFLPSHTLNWHYRSRHEDLIKFSNYHIYDNQLITFPSAVIENFGIEFEYIEKGYYEKGLRFNRKEASRVAESIIQHYESESVLSLGVIAFSEAQQFAIERELAKLLRKKNSLDTSFLDESRPGALFIKNLENVQGDERDVIYFSIGYARDKRGNLSHNFGPLNRDGGHRRLNVAVTRARNKLKVFSSITGSDIDLERTSAQGAMLLKKYLNFAEASGTLGFRNLEGTTIITEQNTSTIEEAIAREFESRGYQVERFLGASEYRIDIAVRSKQDPSKFILAIETDGKIYRSAKTCRDRERLRHEVLKALGWTVQRIYARDWVRSPETELKKLMQGDDSF